MKRIETVFAVAAIAASAHAAVTYNFASVSSGMHETTVAGTATTDRGRMRIDITRGDGAVLRDNMIALSIRDGRALRVIDPASRTYYDVDLEQLLGGVGAMVKQLKGLVTVRVENVTVNAQDAGDGGAIEGFTTRRSLIECEYDLILDAFGQKSTIHVATNVESWLTQALPDAAVFQLNGGKSGIDDIDKLIEAQSGAAKGFPLKQITKLRANEISSVTTMTVSDVRREDVDASRFKTPRGYRRLSGVRASSRAIVDGGSR